jgi:hypothetical protein
VSARDSLPSAIKDSGTSWPWLHGQRCRVRQFVLRGGTDGFHRLLQVILDWRNGQLGSEIYRSAITRLEKEGALLQSELGKQEGVAARARAEAAKRRKAASGTSSISTKQSNLRAAESDDTKVVAAEKKLGELRSKLAAVVERKHRAEKNLESALKSERAAADRAESARRSKEKADRDAQDREDAHRRQTERNHAREIARPSSITVRHVLGREPEPEKLRLLYSTSSPRVRDPLRVDAEVKQRTKGAARDEASGSDRSRAAPRCHRPRCGSMISDPTSSTSLATLGLADCCSTTRV